MHHPVGKGTVPHPYPINPVTLESAGAAILSPWEETLAEVIEESGPCIPVDEQRVRQSVLEIPILLDPYTDYVLDIDMVDLGADEDATGERVYRRHFSTGAYGKFADLAASLQAVIVSHRAVEPGGMQAIKTFFGGRAPQGAELDEQLRAHDIEAMPSPTAPRVVVFWEADSAPPQPVAVLVDAAEPIFRSRDYPTKITDNTGSIPAERWKLVPNEWLRLEVGPGFDPAVAADGFIRAPGDQRALIVLSANSRGKGLKLDLVRPARNEPYLNLDEERATVVDLSFDQAPWEET
jgi:hypothetical protein